VSGALKYRFASIVIRSFVKATLEVYVIKLVVKKEPTLILKMLEAIIEDMWKSGLLSDLRLVTACLQGLCMRQGCWSLDHCDCVISDEMMKVCITGSKNDQLRQGNEVVVARTKSQTAQLQCWTAQLDKHDC